jgi:uncharacterized protein YbbC (DUF1343 family)
MVGSVEGVRFVITDRERLDATRLGLEVAAALETLYPGKIDLPLSRKLIGSDDLIRRLAAKEDPRLIQQTLMDQVAEFLRRRDPYLLYR